VSTGTQAGRPGRLGEWNWGPVGFVPSCIGDDYDSLVARQRTLAMPLSPLPLDVPYRHAKMTVCGDCM